MYICYENIDKRIIYIPENKYWEIVYKPFDDEGNEDGSIYLLVGEEEYVIRDLDYWCMGRENLPCSAVERLYEEILDEISEMLLKNISLIDIYSIENKLIENKYKQLWLDSGYIVIDENGWW